MGKAAPLPSATKLAARPLTHVRLLNEHRVFCLQLARLAARNAAQQALRPVVTSYQSLLRECVALGGDLARERQAGAQLRDELRTARQHAASASEAAKASRALRLPLTGCSLCSDAV